MHVRDFDFVEVLKLINFSDLSDETPPLKKVLSDQPLGLVPLIQTDNELPKVVGDNALAVDVIAELFDFIRHHVFVFPLFVVLTEFYKSVFRLLNQRIL